MPASPRTSRLLPVVAILSLGACGGGGATVTSVPEVTVATSREAARAIVRPGRCPSRPPPAPSPAAAPLVPLIASLAPVLADFSVRLLQDALERAQSEQTATYRASGTGSLGGGSASLDDGPCLIVARGRFGQTAQGLAARVGALTPAALAAVGLAGYPAFYMEASLRGGTVAAARSTGAGRSPPPAAAVTLLVRPELVQFAGTAAPRPGDGHKHIAMVVTLRAAPLPAGATTATAQQDALVALPFDLGRMAVGTAVNGHGVPDAQHPFADQERAFALPDAPRVANIDAFVTETGEPGRVLPLLAATLKDNAGTVESAIADAIKAALQRGQGGR